MGNYAEAVADFDAVAQHANATEKVREKTSYSLLLLIFQFVDENECRIETSQYKNSST